MRSQLYDYSKEDAKQGGWAQQVDMMDKFDQEEGFAKTTMGKKRPH